MRTALAAIFLFLLSFHAARADTAFDLVAAARAQVGITLIYDPSYQQIVYPLAMCRRSAACAATW